MENTYVEMVIEGPADYVRGYIRGFVQAKGPQARVFFDDEVGLREDGLVQKIKETLHLAREVTHLVVDQETADLARQAIGEEQESQLVIRSDRVIEQASFDYEIEIFNRELGQALFKAFEERPQDIVLDQHELNIEEDPAAKGVELYSPAHDYIMKGKGHAAGQLGKIIWLYKELASYDQVDVGSIHLTFADS